MNAQPKPEPRDEPQGNTATLLNDIGVSNSAALNAVSSLIGAAADIAGAIGGVGAVISIVSSLFGGADETQQLLSEIISTINNDFHQLNNDLGAQALQTRNTDLNNAISTPYAHFQSLVASLQAIPPLSNDNKLAQVSDCLATLDQLNGANQPDTVWNVDFDWQTYWTDAGTVTSGWWQPDYIPYPPPGSTIYQLSYADVGYGSQPPPHNADGLTAFSYIYSLPTYSFAVMLFLSVGSALDDMFVTDYDSVIGQVIETLQARHDKIVDEGFKTLVPAHWSVGHLNQLWADPMIGLKSLQPTVYPTQRGSVPYGAEAYFGVVELFSGSSSMSTNYTMIVDGAVPASIDAQMYSKILVRANAKAKTLYTAIGLDKVWETIRALHRVLADGETVPRRFDSWSFRGEAIPLMGLQARSDGSFSLSSLAELIRTTPPYDAPLPRPIGFRQLLT